MITIPVHTDPPQWMQAAVSRLLPPAYREPVLGDLHERFVERDARTRWLGYVGDVVTTVPQVLRSQVRRFVARGSRFAAADDLRSRAEQHQTHVWFRNAVYFSSVVFLILVLRLNTRTGWHFNDVVSLAMTIGWIGTAWRSYGLRGSTVVPASLSWDELCAFHRRELIRQMDVSVREFVYWSLPAVVLILYALTVGVTGFRGGMTQLAALALQTCALAWSYRKKRRDYQRELDRLDREVEHA